MGSITRNQLGLARIRYRFWTSVIGNLITGLATVGIFYWLYRAVDVAAGKRTDFSAVANAAVRMNADRYIWMLIAGICGGGWYRQRKLWRKSLSVGRTRRSSKRKKPPSPQRPPPAGPI